MKKIEFSPDDKSLSMSAEIKAYAMAEIADQKKRGDDSIPSLSNLVNRLVISYFAQKTGDPWWLEREEAINKAARRVAVDSD